MKRAPFGVETKRSHLRGGLFAHLVEVVVQENNHCVLAKLCAIDLVVRVVLVRVLVHVVLLL